jgi:hypothetical protein
MTEPPKHWPAGKTLGGLPTRGARHARGSHTNSIVSAGACSESARAHILRVCWRNSKALITPTIWAAIIGRIDDLVGCRVGVRSRPRRTQADADVKNADSVGGGRGMCVERGAQGGRDNKCLSRRRLKPIAASAACRPRARHRAQRRGGDDNLASRMSAAGLGQRSRAGYLTKMILPE